MKTICHLFLALLLAFAPPLCAEQGGQSQQLIAPDQVPEGLAKSDWSSIRAAYEAGRHAFMPLRAGGKRGIRASSGRRGSMDAAFWPRREMEAGPGDWS
ncbi:MAG: hypothetical protein IPK32_01365 [Verrucomicrobiaceae bacterium]|nr:hypothetical protein [Verrucomicrobiaceae bacterium]